MYTFLVFILFTFASCASNRPVATTSHERIEEKMMPIPVGTDTIEIELCRDTRSECPDGTRSVNQRSLSLWRKNSVSSVGSVRNKNSSVRNKNSVRISSTRGVNISRHETDTTSTLRITLQPDTVFVPYINHIRSDTIVVHDRVCQQKLIRSNMTNLFLILLLIVIFIILFKQKYKFSR